MKIKNRQNIKPIMKQKAKLAGKIRFANFIKSSESEFAQRIKEAENSSIFNKLRELSSPDLCIIRTRRQSRQGYSFRWSRYIDEISKGESGIDVESLLEKHNKAAELIRKIGIDNFETHFLYRDLNMGHKFIAEKCKIHIDEVARIDEFLDDITVHEQFGSQLKHTANTGIYYNNIASIEIDNGRLIVKFNSPYYMRARYEIDYKLLDSLKKQRIFNKIELQELKGLIRELEFINTRKSIICRILDLVVNKQRDYVISGDILRSVVLTQKEVAQNLNIDNSIVSRAIYLKSISIPSGQEKPLAFFFPSRKDIYKFKVKEICDKDKSAPDSKIQEILKKEFGINLSRRSVSAYRKDLMIKPYFKRRKNEPEN